jgi:hypothetical protein
VRALLRPCATTSRFCGWFLYILMRFGVLAFAVGYYVSAVPASCPITTDVWAWYAPATVTAVGVTLLLGAYCFQPRWRADASCGKVCSTDEGARGAPEWFVSRLFQTEGLRHGEVEARGPMMEARHIERYTTRRRVTAVYRTNSTTAPRMDMMMPAP